MGGKLCYCCLFPRDALGVTSVELGYSALCTKLHFDSRCPKLAINIPDPCSAPFWLHWSYHRGAGMLMALAFSDVPPALPCACSQVKHSASELWKHVMFPKENGGFVGSILNLTLERLGSYLVEVGSGSVCFFPYGNF